jgi:hypothetical protein
MVEIEHRPERGDPLRTGTGTHGTSWHSSMVLWTELAILGMAVLLSWPMGIQAHLAIQATVLMIAGAAGV